MSSFTSHDVTYENGTKTLHYIAAGPSNGDLIIFLHGCPGIGLTWSSQLLTFASKGYHCIAPDMPGYGSSTARKVISDYSQESIVTGMLALLQSLNRQDAIWVAHDWGCGTLWSLARTHPEVCRAVAGMTVPYGVLEFGLEEALKYVNREIYPEDQYPYGQWSYQAFYEQSFEKAVAWFEKDIRGILKASFTRGNPAGVGKPSPLSNVVKDDGWFGGISKPPSADMIPDHLTILDKDIFEALVVAFEKTGFWPGDAWYLNHAANRAFNSANGKKDFRLTIPVLFIEAKYDTVCDTLNSRLAERQERLCDDLTFVSIDAGHFVPNEKAEEVNDAIGKWLDERVYKGENQVREDAASTVI